MTASVEVPIGGDIVSFPSWEDAVNYFSKPTESGCSCPAGEACEEWREASGYYAGRS